MNAHAVVVGGISPEQVGEIAFYVGAGVLGLVVLFRELSKRAERERREQREKRRAR